MQKIQPAKNTLDMDFLNGFNKPIGGASVPSEPVEKKYQEPVKEPVTEISPSSETKADAVTEINIDDDFPSSRAIKTTQIVVRTTEKEREELKAYFMKHGVSLSKGLKIAVKYLEQQEKKGQVRFSDIGLY